MSITISLGISAEKTSREQKGNSLLALPDHYTVVDLETTGLDPQWNDIIEFGAERVENDIVIDHFSALVNPGYEIDEFITELTGITNEMLVVASTISEVLPLFIDFIGNSTIIGHNVNFDVNFIYDNCIATLDKPFHNNFIDTMRLSRRLFPNEKHHRLCDLIERFGIGDLVKHRALADVEQTNSCYQYMKHYMRDNGIDISTFSTGKNGFSAKDIKTTVSEFNENSPVYNKIIVFTGTLERMTRKEAMQLVVDHGGLCGDSINKKTNYLVLGNNDYCTTIKDGKSSKQKKAEQLKLAGNDIEIISENVFYDMLEQ